MKITVLIPSKNEAKSIENCVKSVLNQSQPADQIIVVDDASTDKTLKILRKYKKKIKVLVLSKSSGNKSYAQEIGMKYVTGDVVVTTDADTILHPDFIKNIMLEFKDKKVMAAAGYVKSMKHNWLTACRQIEYLIGQEVHKLAQSHMNALFVIPGCAAAYRTKHFKKHIRIDHDTLTEDLDFTYKHHRQNFKIAYSKKAIVYTQDPATIHDYVSQIRRWYAGSWQNLIKHNKVIEKPNNALELSLIFLEGLVFPILILLALIFNFSLFVYFYLSYVLISFLFAVYGAIKDKRVDLLFVFPLSPLVSFVNYAVFIEQFILEVFMNKNNMVWVSPKRRATA